LFKPQIGPSKHALGWLRESDPHRSSTTF